MGACEKLGKTGERTALWHENPAKVALMEIPKNLTWGNAFAYALVYVLAMPQRPQLASLKRKSGRTRVASLALSHAASFVTGGRETKALAAASAFENDLAGVRRERGRAAARAHGEQDAPFPTR